ncbi:TIGR01906 family membrane protein [Fundicoccus culcitae]|uniref:TIGR01906 family membrane protein n=1 Tax=Fundicoccus culcitae TaxID=2969821 RepID=A0ABY5P747_9LACT|nr:TIGR01906 family membrane protein [Fundicoccus culcitae]UUX34310.1 TIGR01906 family membrane protein [Fundicoccus culcitae]
MILFRLKQILAFIITVLSSLSLSISLTIVSSPLIYSLAIPLLNLSEQSGLSSDQLNENFKVIIHYLLNPMIATLEMPYFSASSGGLIHFEEVKMLVQFNLILSVIGTICLLFIIRWIRQQNVLTFVGWFNYAVLLPVVIMFLIVVAFDQVFLIFHQILFNNDLWLFNPATDPVITVLPQELFMAYFFIAILIYEAIILLIKHMSFRRKA